MSIWIILGIVIALVAYAVIQANRKKRTIVAQAGLVRPATPPAAPPTGAGYVASIPANLGVAEVVAISAITGTRVATLELDAIGAPKRKVTADLAADYPLERGERVYVLTDAANPSVVSIAPPEMFGGQNKLPDGANRLDALVLGPQILTAGARGAGVVKSAEIMELANPALAAMGISKWRLELEVTPERGIPYRAELVSSLSSVEKVARICHAGAEVPVRYDPQDEKTIAIDSVAMGFGNPYEALRQPVVSSVPAASAMPGAIRFDPATLGRIDKIHQIVILRETRPGLSLKLAKDAVEGKAALDITPDEAARMQQIVQSGRYH